MRLKSFLKSETAIILLLDHIEDDILTIYTYTEKATFLIERFFLNFNIDLSDITNQNFKKEQGRQQFELCKNIDIDEIIQIIYQIGIQKALGNNYLFIGFLKIYGRFLVTIIVKITNISFIYKYFLKCLHNADIIIFIKSGKSQKTKQIPGIYRLIALLNIINKVIEIMIYKHLSDIMEEYGFFSEGQMDNRIARSIELAIRVVIEAIYTT